MTELFDERMQAAEAALRKRRGLPAGSMNGKQVKRTSEGIAIELSSDIVKIGGIDMPTTQYLKDFQERMEMEMVAQIKNLPHVQLNKTLTIVTDTGTQLGKVKGLRHCQVEELMQCIGIRGRDGHRKNISLTGPMGSGKSTAIKQCAEALGLTYRYQGMSEMKSDVIGSVHPISKEYMPSEFVKTFIEGGVFVAEELDGWAVRACLALNVPLANGILTTPDGKMHERHEDCVIVGCMNTFGRGATTEYVGRSKLDAAFLDRFSPRLFWDYDPDLERSAAGDDEIVDAIQLIRLNAETNKLKVIISPRSSINCSDMVRSGFTMREAFERDFLIGLERAQVRTLLDGVVF